MKAEYIIRRTEYSPHPHWPSIQRYLDLRHRKKVTDNSSLYHYASNNPVRYIDPNGKTTYVDEDTGKIISWKNDDNRSVYSVTTINGIMNLNTKKLAGYTTRLDYAVNPSIEVKEKNTKKYREKTSGYLFLLYRNDSGIEKNLSELGLLDKISNAIENNPKLTGNRGTILGRFIEQIKNGDENDYYFRNVYDFKSVKFALGSATVGGCLDGIVYKNKNGSTHINGVITFWFEDCFTDPYDLFNLIPGELNIDGKAYIIKDTWQIRINGDY